MILQSHREKIVLFSFYILNCITGVMAQVDMALAKEEEEQQKKKLQKEETDIKYDIALVDTCNHLIL